MAQQQTQMYGYSANYFYSPPPPQQISYQPPNSEQSNSRKRPRILGGNRVVKDPVEEKKIKITEENLIEVEKIMAAASARRPHRALQSTYDPFMGNVTDSDEDEKTFSDDEVEEVQDQGYVNLCRLRDRLLQLSRLPPPAFGEEATAEIPEPQVNAMNEVTKKLVPGNPRNRTRIQKPKAVNNEPKKPQTRRPREKMMKFSKKPSAVKPKAPEPRQTSTTKLDSQTYTWFNSSSASTPMPSVFSGSDRSATQSPPSDTPELPKLIQKANIPDKTPIKSKRQGSVESQCSTSTQGSSSTKRSSSKKNETKDSPPRRVSGLENLSNLKIFLHQTAPIEVVDREKELLVKHRQKKGLKQGTLLVDMLKDANCL